MKHTALSKLFYEAHLVTAPGFNELVHSFTDLGLKAHAPKAEAGADPTCRFDWVDDYIVQRGKAHLDQMGIAHIYVKGPVYQGLSEWQQKMGITDMLTVQAEIRELAPQARAIMLHMDSPGGSVQGTRELAELFAGVNLPKVCYTTSVMASAGYYIGVGADKIIASPTSSVGSIGVYIPWVDYQGWYDQLGLDWNPVVSTGSDLKTTGAGPTLTPAQREYLQGDVDRSLDAFKGWVANFRVVDPDAIRGQAARGELALEYNLIDSIGTYDEAYAELVKML